MKEIVNSCSVVAFIGFFFLLSECFLIRFICGQSPGAVSLSNTLLYNLLRKTIKPYGRAKYGLFHNLILVVSSFYVL